MAHPVDRHWLNATIFTLVLVGLVTAAMGAEVAFALSALAVCAVGFGFFYLLFTGGSHFGITVANGLAVYACLFEFFREANFAAAPRAAAIAGLALPVLAFLGACVVQRRRITAAIHARRRREAIRRPAFTRWMPGLVGIAAASFSVPGLGLGPEGQALWLLVSMAAIGGFVAWGVREVVVLLNDVAMVFEDVATRLDAIFMPMLAFLTYYSLLVVVFTCLYRIADMTMGGTQFRVEGHAGALSFTDAFYFSLMTIATVGYGDIAPRGSLVRALAAVEIVLGVMLLLFGFAEIMRARRLLPSERERMDRDRP